MPIAPNDYMEFKRRKRHQKCIFTGCEINKCDECKSSITSYHELPKMIELRKVWLTACDRLDLSNEVTNRRYVCSAHFKSSDYTASKRQILKDWSVPNSNFIRCPHKPKPAVVVTQSFIGT